MRVLHEHQTCNIWSFEWRLIMGMSLI